MVFTLKDLQGMGATPTFQGNDPAYLDPQWAVQGGESVPTSWQQYRDADGKLNYLNPAKNLRPLDQIQYQLPNGAVFKFVPPNPWLESGCA